MNYEEKRLYKIARAQELAAKAERESDQRYKASKQISDFIPFGQPILVGHHSEGRHRRDLDRIDTNMRKSIEADEKAKYYADKAERLENNYTISQDDPEAVTKLKEKLIRLEKNHELMKACNKIIRDGNISNVEKVEQMQAQGLSEQQAVKLLDPDCFGGLGFASFNLTNNNANMNTVKKRIDELQRKSEQETTEREINGVQIIDNVEENRLQAFFPGKPSEEIRSKLKHSGFRWSPSNGCWQSYRNYHSKIQLENICNSLNN